MAILVAGVQALRGGNVQKFTVGATATTATGTFSSQWVEINADIAINYVFGSSSEATATNGANSRLPANTVLYRKIVSGQMMSAITSTGTATGNLGSVWVTEMIE